MRRKCCAKVLMSRSPHAAAESSAAAIRRATRFRALPDFQFFSMSLPVCSYFASSSLISFFMSTTNEYSYSGHCFPAWHYHGGHSTRSTGILPVGRPGVSPSRTLARTTTRNRLEQKITKRTKSLLKNSGSSFPSFSSVSLLRRIRVIRGRLQKPRGSLAGGARADKIGFLWLNIELRGCRVTVLATTSWKQLVSFSIK